MDIGILRCLRKQLVDLEYSPPGRPTPEFFSAAVQRPILWDVLSLSHVGVTGAGDIAVLLLPNPIQVNYAPPVAAPGMPSIKTPSAQGQPRAFYNFYLRFLEAKHITSIAVSAGFQIDADARRPVADQPMQFIPVGDPAFYGNPAEVKHAHIWNAEIWARVERRLVELKVVKEATPVPAEWVQANLKPAATPVPELASAAVIAGPVETVAPGQGEGLNPLL